MKKQVMIKTMSFVVMGAVVIFSFGQGCGKLSSIDGTSAADNSGAGTDTSAGGSTYVPNTQTLSLVYGKEILDHYSSCIGSGLPTDRALAMYDSKKGTISETGAVSTLTAPMLMAATSIAGEICEDLILKEKIAPRIFIGVNLSSPSLPAQNLLQDSMRRIARSCWSRNEDAVESQIVMSAINDSFSGADVTNKAHDAALFMCTAMLASLDSLVL